MGWMRNTGKAPRIYHHSLYGSRTLPADGQEHWIPRGDEPKDPPPPDNEEFTKANGLVIEVEVI